MLSSYLTASASGVLDLYYFVCPHKFYLTSSWGKYGSERCFDLKKEGSGDGKMVQ